jgi:hypothetical protein
VQVFFSFDFAEDLWRASIVRNRWITDPSAAGGAFWRREFLAGDPPSPSAVLELVEQEVRAADVVVVLIGERTAECGHVRSAIRRAAELGRVLFGIYIDRVTDRYGFPGRRGPNPFDSVPVPGGGDEPLSARVRTYDWFADDGVEHLTAWIDEAARVRLATRPKST